jgi:uncharacterized protein involved in exopolysaccharide biosynthesis
METRTSLDEIDLTPYVQNLWNAKWAIVLVSAIGFGAGYGLSYTRPLEYRVQSSWLNESNQGNSGLSALAALAGVGSLSGNSDEKISYEAILSSPAFLERMATVPLRKTGQQPKPLIDWLVSSESKITGPEWLSRSEKIQRIGQSFVLNALTVKSVKGMQVLEAKASDPVLAYDLNLAALKQFQWFNETRRKSRALRQLEFVQEQLKGFELRLKQAEDALLVFRQRNYVISAPELMLQQQRLTREVDAQAILVMEFRKQLELLRIESVKEKTVIQPVIDPVLPQDKHGPKRLYFAAGGFILSLFLSVLSFIGFTFWREKKKRA